MRAAGGFSPGRRASADFRLGLSAGGIEESQGRRRNNHESETVPGISPFRAFQACAGLPAFSALHLAHSIWQLSRTVRPPLHHGVTWSASISEYSK